MNKDIIAIKMNGEIVDLGLHSEKDGELVSIHSEDGAKILRHSLAHIMATALQKIDPEIKFAIGPSIDNGFYYDLQSLKEFSSDDLTEIEELMRELIKQDLKFTRSEISRIDAIELFKNKNQPYKVEILESIDADTVSLYQVGDFLDLCRGPHIPSSGYIPVDCFKLNKVAGAYWRGDSKRPMLQRIYGVAFPNKKELKAYCKMLEEAQMRDHRKLGVELDLFHVDEVAPGNVFWLPKGQVLYDTLQKYIANIMQNYGYKLVKTPQLLNKSLWETSGHWGKFKENMFIVDESETTMAIKPMNCPGHIICYKTGSVKSYRDLPLRYGEFGLCHRNESSGSLHGIMRLRAFTQDDGHIFCTPEQIVSETINFCKMLKEIYSKFGFNDVSVKFSDRPAKRVGADEIWDLAENSLKDAATQAGLTYELNSGEGAFYGPKLEFVLKDCLGRDWQCGTLQVDFNLPERFDIHYTTAEGEKKHPVMLHRAVLGSMERFIGILIEHFNGKLPFWLSPVQFAIVTVSDDCREYAKNVENKLIENNFRTVTDMGNDTLPYKIRKFSKQKVPCILTIGKSEIENGTVSLRELGDTKNETLSVDELIKKFKDN